MYNPCNEITPLVEVYQRWLNDHTRLSVRYGISTRKMHTWHTLTTTGITLADGRRVAMVVPACLLPVSPTVKESRNEGTVSVLADISSLRAYPQLPGILLSECVRLRLDGLYAGLEQVFSRLKEPGLWESLTLLCWYELVNGLQNSDWLCLPGLSEQEVKVWVETRLSQYSSLYSVVDEYVFFACFGFWSDNPQYL
ncbi:hypothetical protein E2B89_21965 [Salmonella enterica]|uniref:Malate transporter n=3 Tax=Salmonella enterica TaxID=28901 RepID=A0A636G9W2_SALET|nr:hypothetical protein [Salmonella enterica]EBL4322940.1 hypothetical protein [Salmonella enterica subsp. enterica serovar Give]EBP3541303.1 hypothetical protein [Salmonella enterica subsp. enterica]EBR9320781.1 hypothetical protein [Salmonella enterica subsp. enterica serovar Panama]ECU9887674.1 hypothetical protein [Salmonella enterica subsp. enterica serovar Oranienburg]ECX6013118.1 hypothetical protein [Salmonella enterica subsp. enterica serovar Rubislaw]EDH9621943.1 hypothetical protei